MTHPNNCVTVRDDSHMQATRMQHNHDTTPQPQPYITMRATQNNTSNRPNIRPTTQKEHYTLGKIASLFAIKERQIGTVIISIYIFCEYLALFGIGSGGISNLGSALTFVKLNNVSNWITTFQTELIKSPIAQTTNYIFMIWLIITCAYLIKQYTSQTPSNLLP